MPAARYWQARLAGLDDASIYDVIWRVDPERMSGAAKQFAFEMLQLNKQRILDQAQ